MKKKAILPNFLICGAPKSGTSSLHVWLADHPEVLGSTEKETYFFVDPGTHMYRPNCNIRNGLDAYSQYFCPDPGRELPPIIMESTPSYLYQKAALSGIPDLPTAPKCLFMVREPTAQIYSLFQYFKHNWDWIPANMSFEQYLSQIRKGEGDFKGNELAKNALQYASYVDFLEQWQLRLGAERMRVYGFDRLRKDPQALMRDIAIWLGIDPDFYRTYDFPKDNETYHVRNTAMQRINVRVRGFIPDGRIYDSLRAIYRKMNTKKPERISESDKRLIDALATEFYSANNRLCTRFGVDTSEWPAAQGAGR